MEKKVSFKFLCARLTIWSQIDANNWFCVPRYLALSGLQKSSNVGSWLLPLHSISVLYEERNIWNEKIAYGKVKSLNTYHLLNTNTFILSLVLYYCNHNILGSFYRREWCRQIQRYKVLHSQKLVGRDSNIFFPVPILSITVSLPCKSSRLKRMIGRRGKKPNSLNMQESLCLWYIKVECFQVQTL